MVIAIYELEKIVRRSFPAADVEVNDLAGGNNHYHLKVTSKCFLGKTGVGQHKMLYKTLEGKYACELKLETSA